MEHYTATSDVLKYILIEGNRQLVSYTITSNPKLYADTNYMFILAPLLCLFDKSRTVIQKCIRRHDWYSQNWSIHHKHFQQVKRVPDKTFSLRVRTLLISFFQQIKGHYPEVFGANRLKIDVVRDIIPIHNVCKF